MKITIETIPHSQQRLGEIGDWYFVSPDELVVRITELRDSKLNFLYGFHEMVEAMLCQYAGITTEMVDEDQLAALPTDDPDSFSGYPGARLQYQHNDALAFEWQLSRLLGVDWQEYAKRVEEVEKENQSGNETANA